MKLPNSTLKQILTASGFIGAEDFDSAARSAADLNRKVEDVLIFRGFISEDALGKLIAENLKVPFANLSHQILTDEILAIIPEKLARTYKMVPFAKEARLLSSPNATQV